MWSKPSLRALGLLPSKNLADVRSAARIYLLYVENWGLRLTASKYSSGRVKVSTLCTWKRWETKKVRNTFVFSKPRKIEAKRPLKSQRFSAGLGRARGNYFFSGLHKYSIRSEDLLYITQDYHLLVDAVKFWPEHVRWESGVAVPKRRAVDAAVKSSAGTLEVLSYPNKERKRTTRRTGWLGRTCGCRCCCCFSTDHEKRLIDVLLVFRSKPGE